jgi:phosphoribulokinase
LSTISKAVLAVPRRPVVVGVDGQGGSGKSTFSRELTEALPVTTWIVPGDDFYSDVSASEKALMSPEEGYEKYFDVDRLKSQVLTGVRDGSATLRYQRYDWEAEALGDWREVPMPEVVVVEGVYTLRPELRDAFDITVFLCTRRETRIARQVARGENSTFWIERWMAAEDFYVAVKGPWEWVDFLVEGE